jgi:hypothetical protein
MDDKEAQAAAAKLKKKGSNKGGGTPSKTLVAGTPTKGVGTPKSDNAEEAEEQSENDEAEEPASKRRKKWFDPSTVHKGEAAAKQSFSKLEKDLIFAQEAAREVMRLNGLLESHKLQLMKHETKTIQSCMEWVDAVLGKDQSQPENLQTKIREKKKSLHAISARICSSWNEECQNWKKISKVWKRMPIQLKK